MICPDCSGNGEVPAYACNVCDANTCVCTDVEMTECHECHGTGKLYNCYACQDTGEVWLDRSDDRTGRVYEIMKRCKCCR